ncbi:MAG: FCD domain-containing protein [Dongiaceae bacterium]
MERADQTLSRLRRLIDGGGLDGGRMPPERELASELGVGRRSLRRALDVLEQEGRISRQQGRGTFLTEANGAGPLNHHPAAALLLAAAAEDGRGGPSLESILDHTNPVEVIEVRLAVEPVMARLAAFRASTAEIKRLQALASETRAAAEPAAYELADGRFHRTIAEAARNALFLAVFDTLHAAQRDAGWRRLGENASCYKRQALYAGFHEEIAQAIAARQGERAQELMAQHLGDVQRHVHQHAFPVAGAAQ